VFLDEPTAVNTKCLMRFSLDAIYLESIYTPDNLFMAFVKIGSILALSKIFSFFQMYHENRINKYIEEETNEIQNNKSDVENQKV
jgi:hypothetical protein